jgi:hypothetical protein
LYRTSAIDVLDAEHATFLRRGLRMMGRRAVSNEARTLPVLPEVCMGEFGNSSAR